MSSSLPESLSASIVYMPSLSSGPRFFVPETSYVQLRPYLAGLVRKHPDVVVVVGAEVAGALGVVFGPEDDLDLDRQVVEKFGVRVPPTVSPLPAQLEEDSAVPRPTPRDGQTHQPQLSRAPGRGRPAKYPFRNLTEVGDHFLAVGASRPKMQATGCNYLAKAGLRDVLELSYLRVERGVLVVVTRSVSGRSRYEADASDIGEDGS